ncbi:MAG: CPBP family intramembrane metalloprotease [Planctomycetales bacterium]|nr:CPBP family intramembrane metalloprotease [Planctomycetales bacterium]
MTASRIEPWVLAVAMLLPTLVTWGYFGQSREPSGQSPQLAYLVGKVVQFGLPLVVYFWALKKRPQWRLGKASWTSAGLVFGGLVLVAAWFGYAWLAGTQPFLDALGPVQNKVNQLGITTPLRFVMLGVFYSLCHSFLEEYYWRWFVYGRLRAYLSELPAAVLSSAAFTLHHLLVLSVFFSGAPLVGVVLSLCVLVGGLYWAWLYERSGSLLGPWLSHLLVDAGIFAVGFQMVFSN